MAWGQATKLRKSAKLPAELAMAVVFSSIAILVLDALIAAAFAPYITA